MFSPMLHNMDEMYVIEISRALFLNFSFPLRKPPKTLHKLDDGSHIYERDPDTKFFAQHDYAYFPGIQNKINSKK